MEFDLIGHLVPYTVIQTKFEVFEKTLVYDFPTHSSRYEILEGYKQYLAKLKQIIGNSFFQWVDGSFVTDKLNPNDIDIVTFLDYQIFFRKENFLSNLIAPESKLLFQVDAAFVPIFPENHRLRYATEWDMNFWKDFYGKTRPDTHQRQMSKGFIQLNF
jgi:hypothetical protein